MAPTPAAPLKVIADAPEMVALWQRMGTGDEQAAAECLARYRPAALTLIRAMLRRQPRLRTLYDSDDFCQDVWKDLIRWARAGLRNLPAAELKALVLFMAKKAVARASRDSHAAKRDLDRQVSLDALPELPDRRDDRADPMEGFHKAEAWRTFTATLPPRQQQIVTLFREGYTKTEVAAALQISTRTLRKDFKGIGAALKQFPGRDDLR